MDLALLVVNSSRSVADALRASDGVKWRSAIETELKCLEDHDTWVVIAPEKVPVDVRPITSRIVLQEKIGHDGVVERHQARLVTHGFRQRPGVDFIETYSPTISFSAVRLALSKAAADDREILHLDVVTTFLESEVQDLYI
jgi:hypothetical protein